jgi:hypothetical protein
MATIVSRARDESATARRALNMGGLSAEEATYWCAAWEAEAKRQNLRPDSQYFWDAGRGWIDAQRSFLGRPGFQRATQSDRLPVLISRR